MGNFLKSLPSKIDPKEHTFTRKRKMNKYISNSKYIGGVNFVDNV